MHESQSIALSHTHGLCNGVCERLSHTHHCTVSHTYTLSHRDAHTLSGSTALKLTDTPLSHLYTRIHSHSTIMTRYPPTNGEIALWPNTRVVKRKYCVLLKRNEANDKIQWYNILLAFIYQFTARLFYTRVFIPSTLRIFLESTRRPECNFSFLGWCIVTHTHSIRTETFLISSGYRTLESVLEN